MVETGGESLSHKPRRAGSSGDTDWISAYVELQDGCVS